MNHRAIFGLVGILTVGSPVALNITSCVRTTYIIYDHGNSGEGVVAAQEIHEKIPRYQSPLAKTAHAIFFEPGEELSYWLHN